MPTNLMVARSVVALLVAFCVTSLLIPAIIRGARKWKLLDVPSDARRVHTHPVPRLGGVGVVGGTVVATALVEWVSLLWAGRSYGSGLAIGPLAASLSIVFATGLIDDLRGVSPRMKLVAQTAASVLLLSTTFSLQPFALSVSGSGSSLGWFAPVLAVTWLVGMTNAFNLVDGADGLAATVALIAAAVFIGVESVWIGRAPSLTMIALAGAMLGFLRFNASPAKIFLGDSGSMTVGFFLAAQSIVSSSETGGRFFVMIPLFCFAFPILDTSIAIARRWIRGEPLSRADGRHIHHQLLALGLSPKRTVATVGAFSVVIAAIGVSIAFAPPSFTLAVLASALVGLCVTLVYGLQWLGYTEFVEFGASVVSVLRNGRLAVQEKLRANDIARQVTDASTLEEVHSLVATLVDDMDLLDIEVVASTDAVRIHGPSRQRLSFPNALPVHLDYPFVWESPNGMREMVLRIWYPRPAMRGRHTAERIALRLAPALEAWFRGTYNDERVRDAAVDELQQRLTLRVAATLERNAAN